MIIYYYKTMYDPFRMAKTMLSDVKDGGSKKKVNNFRV